MDLKQKKLLITILGEKMIESKQNKQFKSWVKLKTKKYRDITGLFLVFGNDIIDKALEHDSVIDLVTTNEKEKGLLISKELMNELQPDTTFSNMAVCKKIDKNINMKSEKVLILDDIQDPSNLGALIRSASAFNFNNVYISNKSADLYHEKTIRSSKGAIFDVSVIRCSIQDKISELGNEGYTLLCADAHNGDYKKEGIRKIGLVLGNEGQGVSDEVKKICDYSICIETSNVESLNVAVAGGILMYLWRC